MNSNPIETLIYDKSARARYFKDYDAFIDLLKKRGLYNAAMDHIHIRKTHWDHVTMLD